MATQRFPLGQLYSTPGALRVLASFPMPIEVLIVRHAAGDWSDMSKDDQDANERAIKDGTRVFSAYQYGEHWFFVITEAGRSVTTILLREEY